MSNQSFKIYNASAGAGKTYTLVFEFIAILLKKPEPESFKELLAITFTNKAANEMKERIILQLKNLANGEAPEEDFTKYKERTGLNKANIQSKAKAILTAILHHYALFAVSTIDKFNLRLMRAFSQDMGLSINFDVEMDVNDILKESVDVLFSELEEDAALTALIANISIENLDEDKHWDVAREITSKAASLFQDKFLEELKLLEEVSLEQLIAFRKKARENYLERRRIMQSLAKEVVDFVAQHNLTTQDFKYKNTGVLSFYENILKGKIVPYGPRQQKIIASGFVLGDKNDPLNATILGFMQEKYPIIEAQILKHNFWQKIYKNINPITTLNEVDKTLEELKQENNILLISEFNKIISEHIKDQPTPFIYEKIGNRYRNYFIDEFQDTSNLQWDNLKPLLDNAIASNDTAMIVGDPKQSIYRFRGGNPELMIGLYNQEDSLIYKENLPKNWRSHEEIIQFNNLLYTKIAETLQNPLYQKLYKEGNSQEVNHKKGGYVQVDYLEKPKKGLGLSFFNDVLVPRLITNIQQSKASGFQYSEMAILVRQKLEGKRIAEALAEEGIAVISNESLLLNNAREVQLLLAFIRFLSDKENKSYRAELLLMLRYFLLIDLEDSSAFYHEVVHLPTTAFIKALQDNGVDLSFTQLPFKTLYDLVSSAVRSFGLQEKGGAYLTFFMDEVLSFQQKKDVTAAAFIEYWSLKGADKSIVMPEGNNAIRLMTIHKSKGLEFPVVFLPAATWSAKADGVWVPIEDEVLPSLYIEGIKSAENLPSTMLEHVIEEEMQAELDALNMLYVATTRAVEQLYIGTELVQDESASNIVNYLNILKQQFPLDQDNSISFGQHLRVSVPSKKNEQTQPIPYISTDWSQKIMVSKEHALLWDSHREQAISYGNKMHAVLEKLRHVEDAEELLTQFEILGYISAQEKEVIAQALDLLFTNPTLAALFNADIFYNERDFIAAEGYIFRPDRLVKTIEGWVLIDYKTGEPLQKHQNQINQYAADLSALGFKIYKKYLLYLGAENNVVEVV